MQVKCHDIARKEATGLDEQFRALHEVFQRGTGVIDTRWLKRGSKG